jgi:hypothetical protein
VNEEQERIWAEQLRESRIRFIQRVKSAIALSSPTRRYALYTEWRKLYGDDTARESAKFSEAVLEGRIQLRHLEKMVHK